MNFGDYERETSSADQAMNQRPLTTQGCPTQREYWHTQGPLKPVRLGNFAGHSNHDYAYLQACVEVTDRRDMRALTQRLYSELLALMAQEDKTRLVRIWNYIPRITSGTGDDESYRQFCWGRADALGDTVLPAASGIGSRDGWLRIGALCTNAAEGDKAISVEHLENPRQLSAYHYPRAYGPRSPSFARATRINAAKTLAQPTPPGLLLLSGTASIVNHETQHPGDLERQSQETAANIQALLNTLECTATPLALRYYLRDAERLSDAANYWQNHFSTWPMPAFYAADLCRSDLELEVEGVFRI